MVLLQRLHLHNEGALRKKLQSLRCLSKQFCPDLCKKKLEKRAFKIATSEKQVLQVVPIWNANLPHHK